jgi:transposase InsO family protein
VAKVTRASFSSVHQAASRPFEEIHLDLIGPIWPASKEGHRYILTIVDSSTQFCAAVPIKLKSDVAATISFLVDVKAKRFGYYPTTIHSDRGSEFLNSTLKAFCARHLIKQRVLDPYTPQQNGLAERFNRTILESLRTILEDSGIDKRFWNKIAKVSLLTLNQIPTHRSKKSPFKLFKGRTLPLDYFCPIGNKVSYVILPEKSFSKLQPKGELGVLIGYTDEIQSYRILTDGGKIVETKNV